MKNKGIFEAISGNYFLAGSQAFSYLGKRSILLKLIFFPIVCFIYILMGAGGIFFRLFIVFDWLSAIVDSLRNSVLNKMKNLKENISTSFIAFIINPFLIALLAPVFFICAVLPKFSSQVPGIIGESMEQFSNGSFREMNKISWGAAHNLFLYVSNATLLMKPLLGIIAIFLSVFLIVVGAVFFVLTIFDLISGIIDKMRMGLVRFTQSIALASERNFIYLIVSPALMILMIPILVFLLIVPKFSTGIDNLG